MPFTFSTQPSLHHSTTLASLLPQHMCRLSESPAGMCRLQLQLDTCQYREVDPAMEHRGQGWLLRITSGRTCGLQLNEGFSPGGLGNNMAESRSGISPVPFAYSAKPAQESSGRAREPLPGSASAPLIERYPVLQGPVACLTPQTTWNCTSAISFVVKAEARRNAPWPDCSVGLRMQRPRSTGLPPQLSQQAETGAMLMLT